MSVSFTIISGHECLDVDLSVCVSYARKANQTHDCVQISDSIASLGLDRLLSASVCAVWLLRSFQNDFATVARTDLCQYRRLQHHQNSPNQLCWVPDGKPLKPLGSHNFMTVVMEIWLSDLLIAPVAEQVLLWFAFLPLKVSSQHPMCVWKRIYRRLAALVFRYVGFEARPLQTGARNL